MDRRSFLKIFSAVPVAAGISKSLVESAGAKVTDCTKVQAATSTQAPTMNTTSTQAPIMDATSGLAVRNSPTINVGLMKDRHRFEKEGQIYLCWETDKFYTYSKKDGWLEIYDLEYGTA